MGGHILAILMPWIRPKLSSLSISLDNISAPKINKKGESGSPCLKPLKGENLPKGAPSRRIENEEVVMHCLI
jgi:hypothetical protein